jgi:hypothetical protein
MHWGDVLTDGALVQGNSVNFAARVASTGKPDEIRLTEDAFRELSGPAKARCKALAPVMLKGFPDPVVLLLCERPRSSVPTAVRIEDMGRTVKLPDKSPILFGRADVGPQGNDIVLRHPDEALNAKISRWHFLLRRDPEGMVLRNDSRSTMVDGVAIPRGGEAPVRAGSVIVVAEVLRLTLLADSEPEGPGANVTAFQMP